MCYSVRYIYYFHNNSNTEDSKYVKNIVNFFNMTAFSFDNIINYSIFIKNKYNLKINDDLFMLFADYMDALKYYYFELDKELSEQSQMLPWQMNKIFFIAKFHFPKNIIYGSVWHPGHYNTFFPTLQNAERLL